jgi:hypothetical protein
MKIQDYTRKNVVITFAIGFIAGITPFAFTRVLPMMLRPEEFVPMQSMHLWIMTGGMVITGIIVGAIIALLYAGTTEALSPKEVFLYALGIPAILITTVTNLTTDLKAKGEIAAMQETANAVLANPDAAPPAIQEKTFKSLTDAGAGAAGSLLVPAAHAAVARPTGQDQNRQDPYLVIIGTYTSREEAMSAFEGYMNRRFRTEAHVPKHIELLEQPGNPPQYVIVYARFKSASEASRASRYLMVNDRDLSVSIVKQSQ